MPKREFDEVQAAHAKWKSKKAEHNETTDKLVVHVMRVMHELYPTDTPFGAVDTHVVMLGPKYFKDNGRQSLLGPRFLEVIARSQEICGITIPTEVIAEKFTKLDDDGKEPEGLRRHVLDVALAMNERGVEQPTYPPDTELREGLTGFTVMKMFVRVFGITEGTELTQWEILGNDFQKTIGCIEVLWDINLGIENPCPETTYAEVVNALKKPVMAPAA